MTTSIRCPSCGGSGWITTNDRLRPPHTDGKAARDEARAARIAYLYGRQTKALYQRAQAPTSHASVLLSVVVDWLETHLAEPEDRWRAVLELAPLLEELLATLDDDD